MKIVSKKKINWQDVKKLLSSGGVVVFPTDTAYGLAADFTQKKSIQKVRKIKERPKEKKIALIAASFAQVKKFFVLNKKETEIAKKHWPGPLTIILKLKNKNKYLGVRVPKNKSARRISQAYKKPVTATSANISRRETPYDIRTVINQFKNKKNQPDLVIDAGYLKKVEPSTIIKIENNKIKTIRKGPINLCAD